GELIAWMWVGLSRFEKAIPKYNKMRGIRARQANIQIGDDNVFQDQFKESRGNNYFVGEVFTNSEELIANSQRDYFNETETRVVFEDELRDYFYNTLHRLYYSANAIKNAYKKQEDLIAKVQDFNEKSENNSFIDDQSKQNLVQEIEKAKSEVEKASKRLAKYDDLEESSPIAEVKKQISVKFNAHALTEQVGKTVETPIVEAEKTSYKKSGYAVDVLSKLNKNERKLVSKIWSIITNNADKDTAEKLIEKIKEEFR
ncbi:MAG: ATP-binding protein, partial [Clostridia bacterium]